MNNTAKRILAYHESGHLLAYLAADFDVPDGCGVGIVGDRFKYRRRGTVGGFKYFGPTGTSLATLLLVAFEAEIVGYRDITGQIRSVHQGTSVETDFTQLSQLRDELGLRLFEDCRVRAWKIVVGNLGFLRAAATRLFECRYLDSNAVWQLEGDHPLQYYFCTLPQEMHEPKGLPTRPVKLEWFDQRKGRILWR